MGDRRREPRRGRSVRPRPRPIIAVARGSADPVQMVAMTVMPGPQLVSAVPVATRAQGSLSRDSRSSGEAISRASTPRPVLRALRTWITSSADRASGRSSTFSASSRSESPRRPSPGLGWKDGGDAAPQPRARVGRARRLPARSVASGSTFETYLRPSSLGARSGVYQASIGCPYTCNFCGVIAAFGSLEKFASPARTEADLSALVRAPRDGRRPLLRQQLLPAGRPRRGAVRAASSRSASGGGARRGST